MALNQVINTRVIDHENKGELLNVAAMTLSNAATLDAHPIRKGEFDVEVTRLDSAIAGLHSFHVHVDSTSADLAAAVASGTFADSKWTIGGTELRVGDILILDAATEQDSDRSWLMITANGNAADFKALGSDVDAAISSAVTTAVSTLTGDAATYTDLGLVEDKIEAMDVEIATHSITKEYAVSWGVADGEGISTATIDTSTDFGTKAVAVRILKDLGDGYYEHLSTSTLEVSSNATEVRLRTDSGSVIAATLVVEVTGVPVV